MCGRLVRGFCIVAESECIACFPPNNINKTLKTLKTLKKKISVCDVAAPLSDFSPCGSLVRCQSLYRDRCVYAVPASRMSSTGACILCTPVTHVQPACVSGGRQSRIFAARIENISHSAALDGKKIRPVDNPWTDRLSDEE